MTPQDIQLIRTLSPVLTRALKGMRGRIWRLLREEVFLSTACREDLTIACGQCGKVTLFTFKSPYNSWHPGWCIECVLQAFYDDAPRYNPYRDPSAPEYDERYDRECRFWDGFLEEPREDDDGPPIAFA